MSYSPFHFNFTKSIDASSYKKLALLKTQNSHPSSSPSTQTTKNDDTTGGEESIRVRPASYSSRAFFLAMNAH